MKPWIPLTLAILTEVSGTIGLRLAATSPRWYLLTLPAYGAALAALSLTLAYGMPLGLAYGVWAAAGVALTTAASRIVFGDRLTALMALGLALIAVGALLVESGEHSVRAASTRPQGFPTEPSKSTRLPVASLQPTGLRWQSRQSGRRGHQERPSTGRGLW